jgi:hypothetical protein
MASRYTITIDVHEGGDVTATIEGVDPIDLLRSDSWDESQKSAADIWIGLGLPATTLETTPTEGSA